MKWLPILTLICFQFLSAQTLKKVSSTPLQADHLMGVDHFGNTYFTRDSVLHKQGPDGTYQYTNFQLGEITSVDIVNPLKIIVFYKDVNTVVLLDNRLSEIELINFNTIPDFLNVAAATNAGNNRLWIFNMDTQQLELFNYRTTTNTVLSQPFPGNLLHLVSDFNYCYTLTDKKLRLFNPYGSMLSEMPSEGFEKLFFGNDRLIGLKKDSLYIHTKEGFYPLNIPSPENPIKDLVLRADLVYIYDGNTVHKFSLTIPKK